MLFLAVVNALPVVISVLPELAVVHKEARNNWYAPSSYLPAKLLIETPLLILPPLLFLSIMGNMSTLTWEHATSSGEAEGGTNCTRFFMVYLAITLVVNATHAWALFLCAIAPSVDVAILMAPGSIMPMALLSGFFKNQQDMPWVFRWFTYIDYLNYGWQALANAGLARRTFDVPAATGMSTGEDVIKTRLRLPELTGEADALANFWANVGVLVGFVIFFRLLAGFFIARRLSK